MTRRILVVDDEPAIRELIVEFLTDEGYSVDVAVDGVEAVNKVQESDYDAILLDVMMPRLNGHEAARTIRRTPSGSTIPVIMMSAVESINGDAGEANAFVVKPFDINRLLETVRQYAPLPQDT